VGAAADMKKRLEAMSDDQLVVESEKEKRTLWQKATDKYPTPETQAAADLLKQRRKAKQ